MKDIPANPALYGWPIPPPEKDSLAQDEEFFAPLSTTLLGLAHRYSICIEKYPHDAPCWSLKFSPPQGGRAYVWVSRTLRSGVTNLREGNYLSDDTVRISGSWSLSDYDSGTSFSKSTAKTELERDPAAIAKAVAACIKEILFSKLGGWTDVKTGYREYWSRTWTKEQFERNHRGQYPVLSLDQFLSVDDEKGSGMAEPNPATVENH